MDVPDVFDTDLEAGRFPEAAAGYTALMTGARARGQLTPEREGLLSLKLSVCYRGMCEPTKALPHALRWVQVAEQLYGPTAVQYANARAGLGKVLTQLRRFDEAAHEVQAVMATMEGRGEASSAQYGSMLLTMADIERGKQRYEQELDWLLRAHAVLQLHPDNQSYSVVISNLAMCYKRLQRPEEARAKYVEALELKAKSHGPEHPEYATSVGNYAMFFAELKLFDKAIVHMERAIHIFVRTLGRQHEHTLASQHFLTPWYKESAKEESVQGTDTRFRLCANCDIFIDREPLVARGTDFLVCGQCRNVPYCTVACHDAYWVQHKAECGQPRAVRTKFVNVLAADCCNSCLCAGARLQCTACKAVRYCDAECQRADWKRHKSACAKKGGQ